MSVDDEDDPATLTGPSYRMTAPSNRGTQPVRVAQASPPFDVRRWASGRSLDDVRKADVARERTATAEKVVRLCIFDLDEVVYGDQPRVADLLESHLMRLGEQASAAAKTIWTSQGLRFKVLFVEGEPTAAAKARFRPLEYPIYVLSDSVRGKDDVKRLHRIMDEHRIPARIVGSTVDLRAQAEESWNKPTLRGAAVPPGFGAKAYVKCAFLKGRTMAKESRDPSFFANVILHEFGHMNNIFRAGAHPTDASAMATNVPLRRLVFGPVDYNRRHADQIVMQLVRLWALQRGR